MDKIIVRRGIISQVTSLVQKSVALHLSIEMVESMDRSGQNYLRLGRGGQSYQVGRTVGFVTFSHVWMSSAFYEMRKIRNNHLSFLPPFFPPFVFSFSFILFSSFLFLCFFIFAFSSLIPSLPPTDAATPRSFVRRRGCLSIRTGSRAHPFFIRNHTGSLTSTKEERSTSPAEFTSIHRNK